MTKAAVMLYLVDLRSGLQLPAVTGNAEARNLSLSGSFLGKLGSIPGAGGASYESLTPSGKVILAAYIDAYKKLVPAVKNYRMQEVKAPGGLGGGGALRVQGSPLPDGQSKQP